MSSLIAYSCNDSSESSYGGEQSNDAQIYAFSVTGTRRTAIDSLTYPTLAKTFFIIDQRKGLIYNSDSLPYGTRLTKFLPTITFASSTPETVTVTDKDSTSWKWSSTDSINFAGSVSLNVKAPGGTEKKYDVVLNVHQIDPDIFIWDNLGALVKSSNSAIKSLIYNNILYVYIKEQNSKVTLYKSDVDNISWSTNTVLGFSETSNPNIETITLLNGNFYMLDNLGKGYETSASDGLNWSATGNDKQLHSILGILPSSAEVKDSLLVVTTDEGKYQFAKSRDLKTIVPVTTIRGYQDDTAPEEFPSTGFSSMTSYNRNLSTRNLLILSGGTNLKGDLTDLTWHISEGRNNLLEVNPAYSTTNNSFKVKDDYKTVLYVDSVYAFTNDSIYTSRWGNNWTKASKKQVLDSKIKTNKNQSIFTDDRNFIWIVGETDNSSEYNIWRGRLNRKIK